jgi:hypothetical protein
LTHFSDLHRTLERLQEITCHFSKEFCENPGNVPTNRKKGLKLQKRAMHALLVLTKVFQIQ